MAWWSFLGGVVVGAAVTLLAVWVWALCAMVAQVERIVAGE